MKKKPAALLFTFYCALASASAQGTLCVNELLYQPRSGEAEYVELYNNSSSAVELADYHIVRWVGGSLDKHYPLPSHTVAAHDYVVLTKDAASVTANYTVKYANKLVECALPTYPNDGGTVVLTRTDSVVVDQFDYMPSMHSRLLRNKAGVSLERRSADLPTNAASNWFSASSTAGYGTPGYENSQSSEWIAEETSFALSASSLSPDGDGYQDEINIDYQLDSDGLMADVQVHDRSGRKVKTLLNNGLLGTHGSFSWDGRCDDGSLAPQGRYLIQITLYDTHGTRQVIRKSIAIIIKH